MGLGIEGTKLSRSSGLWFGSEGRRGDEWWEGDGKGLTDGGRWAADGWMRARMEECEDAVGEELLIKAIATDPSARVKETFTVGKIHRYYRG